MEQKTVAELKQMCRDRGLKLEHKGHKFNKKELIANIKSFDMEKETEEVEQVEVNETVKEEIKKNAPHTPDINLKEISKKEVVDLTREIIDKYTTQEERCVNVENKAYDIGDFIVYIRYVTTKSGKLIKKVGTAKISDVLADNEGWVTAFICETPVGEKVEIDVDDVLYIRNASEVKYPHDIGDLLFKQRMEYKGYKERLAKKYGDNNKAD